ncbi:MAG: carboxypeptidase regulatory-like domain-containing protein, partial [Bryobacterales bacterium]|nr:carboxypeptidase regulatory-like domain-containing protein [Bryobacterales bacterium]
AGDKRNLSDLVMQLGSTAETVEVTSSVELLTPVDSGEKSIVINQKQLQNVAIVGRSAAEFLKVLPGMAATGSGLSNAPGFSGEVIGINGNGDGGKQSALGTFAANGTRPEAMDIIMDGAHVSDPGCNCATPVNANPDMTQEFKVLTSNFAAENAKGPVVINSVTKGGGTDFHGGAYFFARHFAMNSNDALFKQRGLQRPENKFYFPGGNIGGPVLIPGTNFNKNRDKLFFFTGFEAYRQTLDTGVLQSQVPTNAMLNGDFSDTALLNAFTRASGQNNTMPSIAVNGQIPSALLDPSMQNLAKLLPQPNVDPAGSGAGFNYAQALPLSQNSWQSVTRVDYSISDNTKLFVRYSAQRELQRFPVQLWWRNANAVPLPTDINGKNASDSISTSLVNVLNPSLTNEFVFGYTFVDFPNSYDDISKLDRGNVGFNYNGIFNQDNKIPAFVNWGGGSPGMWMTGGFDPILFATKHLYTVSDNLTKVAGTHTFKFGGFFGWVRNAQPGNAQSNGALTYANWSARSTGNSLADFVTGRIDGWEESTKNVVRDIAFKDIAFYAQDSWKVTRNLTLEYGMRFQHLTPWREQLGFGLVTWNESAYVNDPSQLGALTGLNWTKRDESVPQSGYPTRALFYAPRFGMAWDIFGTGNTVFRGGWGKFFYHDPQAGADTVDIAAGFRSTGVGGGPLLSSLSGIVPGTARTNVSTLDPNDNRQPNTTSWSATVSQRLPQRMLWEVAYVGNRSRDLLNNGIANINLAPYGSMFNDPDGDPNNYRPRVNFQDINFLTHNFFQNYHGLQTTLAKQSGAFNYTLAYTWSKAMGIRGGGQGQVSDQLNFRNNYGPLAYDRTHIFAATYVYELPKFLPSGNKLAQGLVNGWQLSGITQLSSGVNIQANNNPNFNLNAPRPDDPSRNIGATWINGTNAISAVPFVTCNPTENLSSGQYINGSCFSAPVQGTNGTSSCPTCRRSSTAIFRSSRTYVLTKTRTCSSASLPTTSSTTH